MNTRKSIHIMKHKVSQLKLSIGKFTKFRKRKKKNQWQHHHKFLFLSLNQLNMKNKSIMEGIRNQNISIKNKNLRKVNINLRNHMINNTIKKRNRITTSLLNTNPSINKNSNMINTKILTIKKWKDLPKNSTNFMVMNMEEKLLMITIRNSMIISLLMTLLLRIQATLRVQFLNQSMAWSSPRSNNIKIMEWKKNLMKRTKLLWMKFRTTIMLKVLKVNM